VWWEKAQQDADGIILDVRTTEEYQEVSIPNAVNINIFEQQAFFDFVEQLDKSKNYYVYCRSGARSGNACQIMNDLGFENAFNLSGGILAWQGPTV
ncbi:MAG: rhodanese-like domain-containing protein, partial [Flavobacterium sp.]|nr:rhodanese-like domain-containing protein [Candidatus Neoflavobacterium equi]